MLTNFDADSIKQTCTLILGHTQGLFDDGDVSASKGANVSPSDVNEALDLMLKHLRCRPYASPQEAILKLGRRFDRIIEQGMKQGDGKNVALPAKVKQTLDDSLSAITDARVEFLQQAGPDLALNDAPKLRELVEGAQARGETSVTSTNPRVGMELIRMAESRRLHTWLLASGLESVTFAPAATAPSKLIISAEAFKYSWMPFTFYVGADKDHGCSFSGPDESQLVSGLGILYAPFARQKLCEVLGLDNLATVWKGMSGDQWSYLLALGYKPCPTAKKDNFFIHVPSDNPDLEDYRKQVISAVKLMESEGFVFVEYDSMKSLGEFSKHEECGPQTLKEYNRRFPDGIWGNGCVGKVGPEVEGVRFPPELADIVPYLKSKGFYYDSGEWIWPGRR